MSLNSDEYIEMTTKYHRVFWRSLRNSYKIRLYAVLFIMGLGIVTAIFSKIHLTFLLKEKYWPKGTLGSMVSFIAGIGGATIFVQRIFRIRLFFNKKGYFNNRKKSVKAIQEKGLFQYVLYYDGMKVNEPYQNAFFLWSDFAEITRYKGFLSFAFIHTTYLIVIPIIEIPNQEVVFKIYKPRKIITIDVPKKYKLYDSFWFLTR